MSKHSKTSKLSKKRNIMINIIFVFISFVIIFGFYVAICIRGQEEVSTIENRTLAKFPKFSFKDFFNGEYQNKLEDSLSDQMIFSKKIKEKMTTAKSETIGKIQSKLIANLDIKEDEDNEEDNEETKTEEKNKESRKIRYIPIAGSGVYHYGDSKYMVFKSKSFENSKKSIDKMGSLYQKHFKDVESYFYLVNTSKSINFNTVDETENQFLTYIKKAFPEFECSGLKISSYEEYMNYFYETDHHWNYKGSYQGYKDIVSLLLPNEKVLEPIETKTFNTYYYGSNARTTAVYTNKEKFTVYDFKVPKHTIYVNGYISGYGNRDMYYNNEYSTEKGYNHYGAFYGGDFAEVVYDYKNPEKENLLVIAPSYSNAINKILASNFNKTYYIDLRHYKNQYGKKFNPEEYCKENKIDKFLLLLSIDHITNGKFEL